MSLPGQKSAGQTTRLPHALNTEEFGEAFILQLIPKPPSALLKSRDAGEGLPSSAAQYVEHFHAGDLS